MGADSLLASSGTLVVTGDATGDGGAPCAGIGTASGTKPRISSDMHGHGTILE